MKGINFDTLEYQILKEVYSLVLVLDSNGMIQYINNTASSIFEIPDYIKPGEYHFTTNISNAYNDKFCEYILDAVYNKNEEHRGMVKYMSPSGEKHVFRIASSFIQTPEYVIITIEDLTHENNLMEKVNTSSLIFSAFLFLLTIWVLFCEFWDMVGRPIPQPILTQIIEACGTIVFIIIYKFTNVSLKDMGVTTGNNKKDIRNGFRISMIIVALLFVAKIVARMINPNLFHPERAFFYFDLKVALSYIITAGLQEFLARCVVQYNLEKIIQGKYREAIAIMLSGLLFATLHIYYGFMFMIAAATLAILEGIIYSKQKSLISIWIIHYICGIVGLSLGFV